MSRKRKNGGPRPSPEARHYEVRLIPAAERGLAKLQTRDARKVVARFRALAEEPHPPGAIKLKGSGEFYRLRSGDYRIIYEIHESRSVVRVVDIGHRREVYRDI